MKRNVIYLFLTLLLASVLAVLAQSPTTSNMGGSQTKDPYGATLDHPNPGSAAGSTGQPYSANNVNEGQTPATGSTTATPAPDNTATSTTPSTDTSSSTANSSTDTSGTANPSLPRTASDLPLLAVIGLLALGGALTVRSLANRQA